MANTSKSPARWHRRSFAPIWSSDNEQRRPLASQETWWESTVAWIRYQQVQVRWDIERAVARLFHRRWGT